MTIQLFLPIVQTMSAITWLMLFVHLQMISAWSVSQPLIGLDQDNHQNQFLYVSTISYVCFLCHCVVCTRVCTYRVFSRKFPKGGGGGGEDWSIKRHTLDHKYTSMRCHFDDDHLIMYMYSNYFYEAWMGGDSHRRRNRGGQGGHGPPLFQADTPTLALC